MENDMRIERVASIMENIGGKRIAVVGDLMLDVYLWGRCGRISQEAPVPIVRVHQRTCCLGGAANVVRNIVTLGGAAKVFGVIGDDENGRKLRELLGDYDADDQGLIVDSTRKTIEKQRVLAGNQQLVRIDHEDTSLVNADIRRRLRDSLIKQIQKGEVDAVIFEDYNKGLLDPDFAQAVSDEGVRAGVLVALDPHPGHPLKTAGLSLMTPNRSEAFGLAGLYCSDPVSPVESDEGLMEVGKRLLEEWSPEALLITLGAQGMALFQKNETPVVIPTKAREVFDVSGAGDTVIAAFTAARLGGANGREAAILANHAAGIVVGKVGTVTVSKEELMGSFKKDDT